ncbi:MAG: outer membrane beta-barrel protein [Bacteroidales bacterium]
MKTIIFTLIAAAIATSLSAQEKPSDVKPVKAVQPVEQVGKVETVQTVESVDILDIDEAEGTDMADIPFDTINHSSNADTAIIRIGKKEIKVIDHDNDDMNNEDEDNDNYKWCYDTRKRDRPGKFNGHWEAVELGFNGFDKPDYSMYGGNEFMSLNQGKSMEVNVNFYELNIGLVKSYVGLVSGMGISFNSYRFDNPFTIARTPQRVEPVALDYSDLSKTKLAISTLKVPLLLEFQIPVNQREGRLYVNAGVVGGVRIGSHTKVKHGDTKDKDRSSFNMNSFSYAATARIGYKDMGLFATYNLTPLFETGKGPELTPFTIGISFSN